MSGAPAISLTETPRERRARLALELRALAGWSGYRKFVIVGIARTGSTLLIDLLNSHPGVLAFGEIFRNPDAIGWDVGPFRHHHDPRLLALYRANPVEFLNRAVYRRWPRTVKAAGFKLFYYHAQEEPFSAVWDELASDQNIHILHIKRRNVLAQYYSLQLAHRTDIWSTRAPQRDANAPIELDPAACEKHFEWVRGLEDACAARFTGHPMHTLYYEDLVADRAREMSAVFAFLGVPDRAASAHTVRQRTAPLRDAIANYGALERHFTGTPWEGFFEQRPD